MSQEETAMTYICSLFPYILTIILPGFIYNEYVRMNVIRFVVALWIVTVVNGES